MKKLFKLLLVIAPVFVFALIFFSVPVRTKAATKLQAPIISEKTSTNDTITLKWTAVKGADGYKIYKYNAKAKKYKLVDTVKGGNSTSWQLSGLAENKTYKFKIAAYVTKNDKASVQKKTKVIKVKTKTIEIELDNFTVYDENMGTHKLSDFYGKPIIINIWATWCGPCVREMPGYDKVISKYQDKINFIMINCEDLEDIETVKQFMKDNGYSFPIYYDFDNEADSAYGNGYIPLTVAIKKDGTIVYHDSGSLNEEALNYLADYLLN